MKNNRLETLTNDLPYLHCYSIAESMWNDEGEHFVDQPGEVWMIFNQELSG